LAAWLACLVIVDETSTVLAATLLHVHTRTRWHVRPHPQELGTYESLPWQRGTGN